MPNYFFERFFNPCAESMKKHKMYAEFFCGTLVITNNKKNLRKRKVNYLFGSF